MSFSCQSYGKWILAGEHSVLRGSEALVFPVTSQTMKFNYTESANMLEIECLGQSNDIIKPFFGALLNKALELVDRSADQLSGKINIENQIAVGAGLGASAALCVNIAHWFVHLGWLQSEQVFNFSKELETIPHGESSGVDIATVLAKRGIAFRRGGEWMPLVVNWAPNWYLLHSGQQGITAKCVKQVNQMIEHDPALGNAIDQDMIKSVSLAKKALVENASEGLIHLKESIDLANACFQRWDLIDSNMREKQQWLVRQGAIATKPVGSGGGGYLLGLWPNDTQPSPDALKKLINCNHQESLTNE